MGAHYNMVNDFGEAIAAFVAGSETRQIAQRKNLFNTTNINTNGAATNRKIGLLSNSLFL